MEAGSAEGFGFGDEGDGELGCCGAHGVRHLPHPPAAAREGGRDSGGGDSRSGKVETDLVVWADDDAEGPV